MKFKRKSDWEQWSSERRVMIFSLSLNSTPKMQLLLRIFSLEILLYCAIVNLIWKTKVKSKWRLLGNFRSWLCWLRLPLNFSPPLVEFLAKQIKTYPDRTSRSASRFLIKRPVSESFGYESPNLQFICCEWPPRAGRNWLIVLAAA